MTLNCIAVDDEPLALQLLCDYIQKTPYLNLVASYTSSVEALKSIHEDQIHIAFLDIRMPDLSGIDLAKILNRAANRSSLRVILTTAFDHYAIDGFKVDALDYLLKPFNYTDFASTAYKAYSYFELLSNPHQTPKPVEQPLIEEDYLYVKAEYQLVKIAVKDILYVESLRDYVKIFLASESEPLISLIRMKNIEEKLQDKGFMRIHRSFIVAMDKIKSVTKNSVIINKTSIPVTEQYKGAFAPFYNAWSENTN